MQRRVAVFVPQIGVGVAAKKQYYRFLLDARRDAGMKHGISLGILDVDIGALCDKFFHHVYVTRAGSLVQRRSTGGVFYVCVGVFVEQMDNKGDVSVPGGIVQRGKTVGKTDIVIDVTYGRGKVVVDRIG